MPRLTDIPPPREEAIHAEIVRFLRVALPPTVAWHHSPNEGKRGPKAQKDLRNSGTRAGWPDLEFVHLGVAHFIELKALKGKLSESQEACRDELLAAGARWSLARSLDEVYDTVREWGFPVRCTLEEYRRLQTTDHMTAADYRALVTQEVGGADKEVGMAKRTRRPSTAAMRRARA